MADTATTLDGSAEDFDFTDLKPEDAETVTEPEVKKTRGLRASLGSTTPRRRGRKPVKKLQELQAKLSSEMFQAGVMIGLAFHTTGMYICQESDAFTKAVIDLAQNRPEWVDALEHIADIQPGLVIGRTLVGIGGAFAVDRDRADPEKQVFKLLGVYQAWHRVQENMEPGERVEGSAYQPPPSGAFVPVG